jgi:hypothetical protein
MVNELFLIKRAISILNFLSSGETVAQCHPEVKPKDLAFATF